MASAASATFRLITHSPKSKPSFPCTKPFAYYTFPRFLKHPNVVKLQIAAKSTDVSKEDMPEAESLDQRRLEEKFAVLNTGIYECRSCGYLYNEAAGDPSYPIAPGLPFDRFPEDWRCPTCGAAKGFFASKSVEIAGFAQNQQFGLGGNTLTSGQKAILIYELLKLLQEDSNVCCCHTVRQLDVNEDSSIWILASHFKIREIIHTRLVSLLRSESPAYRSSNTVSCTLTYDLERQHHAALV